MKAAMVALLTAARAVSDSIGLEGALLLVGTSTLAAFASFLHPAGALLVIGCVTLALGFSVAWKGR